MNDTQPEPKPYDVLSEEFADFALDECGEFADLADRAEVSVTANRQTFNARVLGFGSSFKQDGHTHLPGTPPVRGERCPACRWADVAILRVDDTSADPATLTYVLALMGKSVVPGESHRIRIVFTADPMEVFRNVFVPNRGPRSNGADRKIPFPNAVAFRHGAKVDAKLNQVLEDHEDVVPDPEPEGSYLDF